MKSVPHSLKKGRLGASLSRLRTDMSGATAVEFAMISPLFLAMVFVTLMVGMLYMAKSELDAATQSAARAVMTGQATTSSQLQTALCNAIGGMFTCSNLMINLNAYSSLSAMNTATPTLTYNGSGGVSNTFGSNFGSVGSIMVLQVMYQFPVIGGQLFSFATQPNGTALLVSTAVFVNE